MLSSAVPAVAFMPTFVPFFMAYAIQVRETPKLGQVDPELGPTSALCSCIPAGIHGPKLHTLGQRGTFPARSGSTTSAGATAAAATRRRGLSGDPPRSSSSPPSGPPSDSATSFASLTWSSRTAERPSWCRTPSRCFCWAFPYWQGGRRLFTHNTYSRSRST